MPTQTHSGTLRLHVQEAKRFALFYLRHRLLCGRDYLTHTTLGEGIGIAVDAECTGYHERKDITDYSRW